MNIKKPKIEIILKKEKGLPIIFFRNFDDLKFLNCWQNSHEQATYEYFRSLKKCNLDEASELLKTFKNLYFSFEVVIKKKLKISN